MPQTPYLSALDFLILDFGVYFKLGKKLSSKPTWFFFKFELDFYCLCSLQKSISKSNWFFSFLNLIFWNWKKLEWHSISQKSSGERQGDDYLNSLDYFGSLFDLKITKNASALYTEWFSWLQPPGQPLFVGLIIKNPIFLWYLAPSLLEAVEASFWYLYEI